MNKKLTNSFALGFVKKILWYLQDTVFLHYLWMQEPPLVQPILKDFMTFRLLSTVLATLQTSHSNKKKKRAITFIEKEENSLAHKSLYTALTWLENKIRSAVMSHRWKASIKAYVVFRTQTLISNTEQVSYKQGSLL